MSVVIIFADVPPDWARELTKYGYKIATVDDVAKLDLGNLFIAVVGNKELADRLGAAFFTAEELKEFLEWLRHAVDRFESSTS